MKLRFSLAPDARAHALHGGAEVVGGDGEGRELVGGYALLEVAEADGAAHAHQGGLAAQGLQVGARVASGQGCYLPQVEVGVRGHLAGVDTQYVQPRFGVGQADLDLVVEPARAPERGVQRRRPVGGGNDADSPEVVQPVHEGEKLGDEGGLEALAHHVARGGEGVYLVEEDDRGRLGPRLVEDGAQLGLALAPELVEDLRPRDGYEVGPALVGDGPRQKGLARPRWPVEEDSLVRPDVELAEDLGVGYGQFHRLADQVYGLAHPADVLVAGSGHVATARRRAARRSHPRSPTPHAPCEAFDEALPVLLQVSLSAPFPRLHDFPAREISIFPVTPGLIPARVYPLGEAGHYLGGRVEVEDGAPDTRAEIREDALGDGFLVHLEDGLIVHLAEGVP